MDDKELKEALKWELISQILEMDEGEAKNIKIRQLQDIMKKEKQED